MKPGYPGMPVTFIFFLSCFGTFLIHINGVKLLSLAEDNDESQLELVNAESIIPEVESQFKFKSCAELSFNYPLQCIEKGCNLDEFTGECTEGHTHPKSEYLQKMYSLLIPTIRKRRDAEAKCFHFNQSPRICAKNGCKYSRKKKKCVKLDGSEDWEPTKNSQEKGENGSKKKKYKFMEKPTAKNCKKYHGQPRACGFAGCSFDKWTHRCGVGRRYGSSQKGKSENIDDQDGVGDSGEMKDCGKYDGSSTKCTKYGCDYDDSTKACGKKANKGGIGMGRSFMASCSQFNSDLQKCAQAKTGCLFNETSEECIEAQEPEPPANGDGNSTHPLGGKWIDKKYCNFLYGKKKNCNAAGCEHDEKNKKCDAGTGNKFEVTDTVSVTYVETKPDNLKNTAEECSEFSKSPRGCLFAGCKFDEDINKCLIGTGGVISIGMDVSAADIAAKYLTAEECALFNKKERPCVNDGCRYLDNNETCVPGKRRPNKEECSGLDEKPVPCIKQGCLYDAKHKTCFVSDFHELSRTIKYVRVKSKHRKLDRMECSELDGSASGCTFAGCKYDEETKKCLEGNGVGENSKQNETEKMKPLTLAECAFFNNKLRACGYAGCRYMTMNHKCIIDTDAKSGCGVMNGDAGSCTEAGCEYDKVKHKCSDKVKGNFGRSFGGDADIDGSSPSACSKFNGKWKSCTQQAGCKYDKSAKECTAASDGSPDSAICGQYKGNMLECRKNGCRYDKRTRRCLAKGYADEKDGKAVADGGKQKSDEGATEATEDCEEYDGKQKRCNDAGCKYDKPTKKCLSGNATIFANSNDKTATVEPTRPALRSQEDCSKFDRKSNKCIRAGCLYDIYRSKCNAANETDDAEDAEESFTTLPIEGVSEEHATKDGRQDERGDESGGKEIGQKDRIENEESKVERRQKNGDDLDGERTGTKGEVSTKAEDSRQNEEGDAFSGNKVGQKKIIENGESYGEKPEGNGGDLNGESIGKNGDVSKNAEDCAKYNGKRKSCTNSRCAYDKQTHICSALDVEADGAEDTGSTSNSMGCGRFSKAPKKCIINDGCEYDKTTKTCSTGGEDGSDMLDGGTDGNDCGKHDGNQNSCIRQDGCAYDESAKKCTSGKPSRIPSESENCNQYHRKPNECIGAACWYNKLTEECSVKDSKSVEKVGTAVDNGAPETQGDCEVHYGKEKQCTQSGCKYDTSTNKCIANGGAVGNAGDIDRSDGVTNGVELAGSEGQRLQNTDSNDKDQTGSSQEVDSLTESKVCAEYNGRLHSCISAGCEYDNEAEACFRIDVEGGLDGNDFLDSEPCSTFNHIPRRCIIAGCKYDNMTNVCSAGSYGGSDMTSGERKEAEVDKCGKHDGKQTLCAQEAGCAYDNSTKKCSGVGSSTPLVSQNCGQYQGKRTECQRAGCLYSERTNECLVKMDGETTKEREYKEDGNDPISEVSEDCKDYDGNDKRCTNAGCKFNKTTKKCTALGDNGSEESGKSSGGGGGSGGNVYSDKNVGSSEEEREGNGGNGNVDAGKEMANKQEKKVDAAGETSDAKNCSKYSGNPKPCVNAGCRYDKSTETCSTADAAANESVKDREGTSGTTEIPRGRWRKFTTPECSELDESKRACNYVGCRYKAKAQKCLVEEDEEESVHTANNEKPLTAEECSVFDKNQNACNLVDCCRYIAKSLKCTAASGETFNSSSKGKGESPSSSSTSATTNDGSNDKEVAMNKMEDECEAYNGKRKECVKAGCNYDKGTEKCTDSDETEYEEIEETRTITKTTKEKGSRTPAACSEMDGKPKACRSYGCKYVKKEKRCIDADDDDDDAEVPSDAEEEESGPTTTTEKSAATASSSTKDDDDCVRVNQKKQKVRNQIPRCRLNKKAKNRRKSLIPNT